MDIRFCQRYNEGMYCEVFVTSQTKTESAELFTMVNYEGLELALNAENSQLIRIADGTFKTYNVLITNLMIQTQQNFNSVVKKLLNQLA
jgi:hypothetical protein